jgi:hypothetical protein
MALNLAYGRAVWDACGPSNADFARLIRDANGHCHRNAVLSTAGGVAVFNWLSDNKQWVFSGIGVPVVVALVHYLFRRGRGQGGPSISKLDSGAGRSQCTPSLPSGNDIAIAVHKAPPYQREQVGRNYVGLYVSWPVIVCSVIPLDDGVCIVNFAYGDKTWGASIGVRVDVNDYPRLKTAPAPNDDDPNSVVHGWIEGTIKTVTSGGIEVDPNMIEFFN